MFRHDRGDRFDIPNIAIIVTDGPSNVNESQTVNQAILAQNGKYVHSINPKNGLALNSNILSVSVIAPSCIAADAFATALMVMPLNMGRKVVNDNQKIEASWVISRNDDLVQIKSSGWD